MRGRTMAGGRERHRTGPGLILTWVPAGGTAVASEFGSGLVFSPDASALVHGQLSRRERCPGTGDGTPGGAMRNWGCNGMTDGRRRAFVALAPGPEAMMPPHRVHGALSAVRTCISRSARVHRTWCLRPLISHGSAWASGTQWSARAGFSNASPYEPEPGTLAGMTSPNPIPSGRRRQRPLWCSRARAVSPARWIPGARRSGSRADGVVWL